MIHSILINIFRLSNRLLNPLGILISKPEVIHGSPRFSGATLWSRRLYDFRFYFELLHDIEGDIIESGVHWGYGILAFLHLTTTGGASIEKSSVLTAFADTPNLSPQIAMAVLLPT